MNKTLVRVLSTGRAGTKFLSGAFAAAGFKSYHEDLYAGEPSSALIEYTRYLGDLWFNRREFYYELDSNFVNPYLRTVHTELGLTASAPEANGWLARLIGSRPSLAADVLVDCSHLLALATPIIVRRLDDTQVSLKQIILYRNPLKMIHAIYKVENHPQGYLVRPASFAEGQMGIPGAAKVWLNSYRHIYDLYRHYNGEGFVFLDLEKFSHEPGYAVKTLGALGLEGDLMALGNYIQAVQQEPIRTWKYDTARNSDLYKDPEFVFTEAQADEILESIKELAEPYQLDLAACRAEYFHFHFEKKQQLEFK